ncbi:MULTISPECIES: hypothetical protein [Mesorhizobium]|uniref:Uncharacterized protein n=1 Tax=Mesorhizobium intechi TaxID=537601 RepID=A0A8T9AQV1_9HYPH|nr:MULTISPECIES: hypothetical protein [Mesorhizobium]QKD19744.1 hypothetical protein HGP13_35240 [Mesorhizobium sp. NZP2077]TSE11723.1 hypothetical protein C1D09_012890 [Mesorhizobium intechi]
MINPARRIPYCEHGSTGGEHAPVLVDLVQYRGRDRKTTPGGLHGKHVVNQVAVNTAEGEDGGGDDGIKVYAGP